MNKEIIATKSAPEAIGPYSQAIRFGNMVFVSGQIGLDPQTGGLVLGGVETQTHQALQNLKAIIEASGSSMENVVKTTCFLKDMNDFPIFNRVYANYFTEAPPARETVGVASLPKDALVEISCIAVMRQP